MRVLVLHPHLSIALIAAPGISPCPLVRVHDRDASTNPVNGRAKNVQRRREEADDPSPRRAAVQHDGGSNVGGCNHHVHDEHDNPEYVPSCVRRLPKEPQLQHDAKDRQQRR